MQCTLSSLQTVFEVFVYCRNYSELLINGLTADLSERCRIAICCPCRTLGLSIIFLTCICIKQSAFPVNKMCCGSWVASECRWITLFIRFHCAPSSSVGYLTNLCNLQHVTMNSLFPLRMFSLTTILNEG